MPVWAGCLVTAVDTLTFLAVQHLGVRYLEGLVTVLIGTMSVCFFINWGAAHTDAAQLLAGWAVPTVRPPAARGTRGRDPHAGPAGGTRGRLSRAAAFWALQ